jgi:protein-tyrosine phosphatase
LAGFNAVVLAAEEWQFPAEMFEGVAVIHAPNNDDGSPLTRDQLSIAVNAARQAATRIQDGQKVLSTCAAGVNRSGLVSALTLHFRYGWSGDRCIEVVRKKRKLSNRLALSNQFFTQALRRLPANC